MQESAYEGKITNLWNILWCFFDNLIFGDMKEHEGNMMLTLQGTWCKIKLQGAVINEIFGWNFGQVRIWK